MQFRIVLIFSLALVGSSVFAKPPSREVAERQGQVLEQLKESLADKSDEDKIAAIARVWSESDESDIDQRLRLLDLADGIPGAAAEAFLIGLLTTEEDAGLRSQAATALGKTGSEKCLAVLSKVAASDRTTNMQMGCMRVSSSARRAATFALAELAGRFPKVADTAAAELRALPVAEGPKDNESLWDARQQSLYQITHEALLIEPFLERLKSDDPKVRRRGVLSLGFLKLDKAPAQLIFALQDADADVRISTALVLGEIKDPRTVKPLMAVATDGKLQRGVRSNAIGALGQMRAAAAAELMETLLADEWVSADAAIALYRITGKKTRQFPEGYNAD
jgi:HEAT repeat protein